MNTAPLQRAIEICGGQTALASLIGVKQGHVWWWLNRSKRVPAEKAIDIEGATRGFVSRSELRPDIYPPAEPASGPSCAVETIPAKLVARKATQA